MSIAYQTILPDPNNPIGNAGQNTGTDGPGYRSVQLTSNSKIMKTRTNSGRVVARAVSGQHWELAISYNPLTRAEFEPIYNFLLNQRGGLKPFFVSLPQYRVPQNGTFATYAASNPIRVNTVAPTFVATPMVKKFFKNIEFKKLALGNIPMGKLATESDVATSVCFLASSASSMVTATSILVDGGWTAK